MSRVSDAVSQMPLNAYLSIFVAFYEVPLKPGLNVMYKDAA